MLVKVDVLSHGTALMVLSEHIQVPVTPIVICIKNPVVILGQISPLLVALN